MNTNQAIGTTGAVVIRNGSARDWQHWAPYAALAWSLIYAIITCYWAVSGQGFPYTSASMSDMLGPLLGRLGPVTAWIVVIMAGVPAAAMGAAMLGGVRSRILRPFLIATGVLLSGVLLLFMTSLGLLVHVGYLPYAIRSLLTGATFGQNYMQSWIEWATIHQVLCLIGGFLWLAATVCYARRSADACLYCGRRDAPQGWQSPKHGCALGPDSCICIDGCTSLLRIHPLFLGVGVPARDE